MPRRSPSHVDRVLQALIALAMASIFFSLTLPIEKRVARLSRPEGRSERANSTPHFADSLIILLPPEPHEDLRSAPLSPVVFSHGARTQKLIALTFDACSTTAPSRYDERITNILLETGTPATLFLGGMWMLEEPGATKELASHPLFELANHTFHHLHLTTLSDDRIREELSKTQNVLDSLTGRTATIFRAPFGEYDDRVVRIAAELGITTIQYDLASGDPDPKFMKGTLVRYVTSMARNGSIIVMHINGRGWHTAEALPEIIQTLRGRGFTFVTVSELIGQSTKQTVQTHEPGEKLPEN